MPHFVVKVAFVAVQPIYMAFNFFLKPPPWCGMMTDNAVSIDSIGMLWL